MSVTLLKRPDPRQELLDMVGNLSGFHLFKTDVLVALYLGPQKSAGGILLPPTQQDEAIYQGKVGLIIKMGPSAFQEEAGKFFGGYQGKVGDWIWSRAGDGMNLRLHGRHGVHCRVLRDEVVRGVIQDPDEIW